MPRKTFNTFAQLRFAVNAEVHCFLSYEILSSSHIICYFACLLYHCYILKSIGQETLQ